MAKAAAKSATVTPIRGGAMPAKHRAAFDKAKRAVEKYEQSSLPALVRAFQAAKLATTIAQLESAVDSITTHAETIEDEIGYAHGKLCKVQGKADPYSDDDDDCDDCDD